MKQHLAFFAPRVLEGCFLLLVLSAVAARKAIARSLYRSRWLLGGLAALAFVLVSTLPPRTHRIYYDEDIYENVAQNILWTWRAQMCNDGTIEEGEFRCRAGEYNKEPNAFPFMLSLVFRLTGVSERAAHVLNNALFAFGVGATFWAGLLLLGDRYAAGTAALVLLLTPQNLLWGATVAVEPGTAAAAALAVGAFVLFLKEMTLAPGLFAATAVAFASQWRPESALIIAVTGVAALVIVGRRWADRRIYAAGAATLVLILVHLAHLWAVRGEGWGSPETGKFAWSYVRNNLQTNALYYVAGHDFPLLFTVLAFLGAFTSPWRSTVVLLFWFVAFFGVFIPFHAGSYRYGVDVRFALVSAAPLSLLAGRGATYLKQLLSPRVSGRLAAVLPVLAIVYAASPYLQLVRTVGTEAWAARADHAATPEFLALVPPRSIVLTHNPGMIQVMGWSAAQASVASYQPALASAYFNQFPGGVYFHYNFWCNVPDPVQNKFCAQILSAFPTQVIAERSAGFNRYVLYRLMPPSSRP